MGTFYLAEGRKQFASCRTPATCYAIPVAISRPTVAIFPIPAASFLLPAAIYVFLIAYSPIPTASFKHPLAIYMKPPTCLKPPIASFKKPIACCSVPIGFSGIPVTVCAAARPPCASIGRNSRSMAAIQQGWVDDDSTLLSPGIFGKISSALLPFADLIPCPFPQPQAFRIGDQLIVSMPFEVLVEIARRSRKRAPLRAPSSSSWPTATPAISLPRTRSSWAATKLGWGRPGSKSTRPRCW